MSDGEDDLEFLRSAALASLGKKKAIVDDDADDLDKLRQVALTSRKIRNDNENDLFEKLQPARSSNLINLTPDPGTTPSIQTELKNQSGDLHQTRESDDSDDGSEGKQLPAEETSSENCSAESSDEENSVESRSKTSERNEMNEEDDLLNAIDQFLDEGVVMLEEVITPVKSDDRKKKKTKSSQVKPKTNKAIRKNVKKRTDSVKTKEAKRKPVASKETKVEENSRKSDNTFDFRDKNFKKVKSVTDRDVKPSRAISERKVSRNRSANWKSSDLPLNVNRVEEGKQRHHSKDIDSVHSSDLSFLSDSSDKATKVKDSPENIKPDIGVSSKSHRSEVKRKYIRVNKNKLGLFNKESDEESRPVEDNFRMRPRIDDRQVDFDQEDLSTESRHVNNSFPDLREKLKHKGVKRRVGVSGYSKRDQHYEDKKSNTENNSLEIPARKKNKIYMKPGVYHTSNDYTTGVHRPGLKEDGSSRLIVTRNVSDNGFEPITVRLDDGDDDNEKNKQSSKSFRRKRSVVQFMPDTPVAEKQKKLEIIKKQAEKEKQETFAFSDLSENFDDFEIEEPDENTIDETAQPQEQEPKEEAISDTRRIISAPRLNLIDSDLSDYDEEANAESVKVRSSVCRKPPKPAASPLKDQQLERSRIKRRRKSNSVDDEKIINEDIPHPRRYKDNLNGSRMRDSIRWKQVSPVDSRSHKYRVERPEEREKVASVREDGHFRRKRRVGVMLKSSSSGEQERHSENLSSRIKPVRERLGYSRGKSPHEDDFKSSFKHPRERRRKPEENHIERSKREKDVDERIRRINKKNAEIMERRRMIELEERKFQLRPGPL